MPSVSIEWRQYIEVSPPTGLHYHTDEVDDTTEQLAVSGAWWTGKFHTLMCLVTLSEPKCGHLHYLNFPKSGNSDNGEINPSDESDDDTGMFGDYGNDDDDVGEDSIALENPNVRQCSTSELEGVSSHDDMSADDEFDTSSTTPKYGPGFTANDFFTGPDGSTFSNQDVTDKINQIHQWLEDWFNEDPMSKDKDLFTHEKISPYEFVDHFGATGLFHKALKDASWDDFESVFGNHHPVFV